MKECGIRCTAVFTIKELKVGGFPLRELKEDFQLPELKMHFTLDELRLNGFHELAGRITRDVLFLRRNSAPRPGCKRRPRSGRAMPAEAARLGVALAQR